VTTERLYYNDACLKECTARVISCDLLPSESNGDAKRWQVILDRTAFYPTSGGQPHDLGRLGVVNLIEVRDESEEILHIVDAPVPPAEVNCKIDWPRRFDHMQQHTGQHLLSAIFQTHFSLHTVSFHLGEEICTIDLRGAEPSEETLAAAERAANHVVYEDRPITVRYGTAEELSKLGIRKQVHREGTLRAIEISGVDLQPCGGTHVNTTGQIGMIAVRRYTKIRQDWRVEFLCGQRAESAARSDFQLLRQVADKFGCAAPEMLSAAGRVLLERDSNFKKFSSALERLAAAEATLALQASAANEQGFRVICRIFENLPAEFVGAFASQLAKSEKTIALLARAECGHAFFAQHPSAAKDMAALLKQVMDKVGGKGGGTRDFARGKLADPSSAHSAISIAQEILKSS
jgi:alanyl-tRNA synthetase